VDHADLRGAQRLVAREDRHLLRLADGAAADAADGDAAQEARVIDRGDLELQRRIGIAPGRGHVLEHRVEEGAHVRADLARLGARPPVDGRCVDHREIELVFVRAQLVHEVERLVHDPVGARRIAIHLVHDDDRLQPLREGLARDEARLGHRTFDRVDEQQHAVHHRKHALDLAAEVRVAGRVDDVDVHAAIVHRRVLREDGDAALALEVVGIHHALDHVLVGGEGAGLLQELVDERGLAVVDVRDDRDVA